MGSDGLRRSLLGGLDREQVEAALRERDERLERLEREAQLLAGKVIDAERRAAEAESRARRGGAGATGGLAGRLEEVQEGVRRRAERLRLGAREAVALADRAGELSRLREELAALVAELAGLAGVGAPGRERDAAEPPAEAAERTYAGAVEVEVGPLRDFAQLTSFEDAVSGMDSASGVRVSNFADGRATFSISFARPVELVRELEERAPFPFSVRAAGAEAIVLDVGPAGEAGRAA